MHVPVFRDARTGDTKLQKEVTEAQRSADGSVIELRDMHGEKVEEEVEKGGAVKGDGMPHDTTKEHRRRSRRTAPLERASRRTC